MTIRARSLFSIILHLLAVFLITLSGLAHAEPTAKRIGIIASLSGFAAPYGVAVLRGAELAVSELNNNGHNIELSVQDDQSDPSKVVSAYRYLKDIKGVQLIIGGSWWIKPVIKVTERDGIPLISCETRYDNDFVPAKTYFILAGRVSDWVKVYEPFFASRSLQTASVVRFLSGFGQSIADEMKRQFSSSDRKFIADYEYQDLALSEARTIALKLKAGNPDVTYIDGQPEGLANFLKRRSELGMQRSIVIGHSAIETALKQGLLTPLQAQNVYFLRRREPGVSFSKNFEVMFKAQPKLNADLGYYAMHLGAKAMRGGDVLATLRGGINILGEEISFDENQVAKGVGQEIYFVRDNGEVVRWEG